MPPLHLLIALGTRFAFDREAFLSIASVAQGYTNLVLNPWHPGMPLGEAIRQTHSRGMIVSRGEAREIHDVVATGLPAVNVANCIEQHKRVPVVGTDDVAIARTVADYYLGRQFKHFAYAADSNIPYFYPRRDAFVSAVRAAGFECLVGPPPMPQKGRGWDQAGSQENLSDWLLTLPRPVAIMCPYDAYAVHVVNACRLVGLRVPEQVSVIGVDNDLIMCTTANPQISSVRTPAARIGAAALELVLRLLDGDRPPAAPVLFPPAGIHVRGSTVDVAIYDPEVATAVNYIRMHLHQQVGVDDLVHHLAISRRTLERKFVAALGRTPLEEIRAARIALAQRLLIETDLTLPDVARRSGLLRHQRLCRVFQENGGITPTEFREQFRSQRDAH